LSLFKKKRGNRAIIQNSREKSKQQITVTEKKKEKQLDLIHGEKVCRQGRENG